MSCWRTCGPKDPEERIRKQYQEALAGLPLRGAWSSTNCPSRKECLKIVPEPAQGQEHVRARACSVAIYRRDAETGEGSEIANIVQEEKRQGHQTSTTKLFDAGYAFARDNLDYEYRNTGRRMTEIASDIGGRRQRQHRQSASASWPSGIEIVSRCTRSRRRRPRRITLPRTFHLTGGFVHQAEDEIAAIGFAIGASYAGKTACTITSGPGMALKTEMIGLAVMAELPLVIVDVQRGGPSTGPADQDRAGRPARRAFTGSPGDSPKIVIAAATISTSVSTSSRHGAQAGRVLPRHP